MKTIGRAKRIMASMPLGARRGAWDCRPFGLGRIVTPIISMQVEIAPGTHLDLGTGELLRLLTRVAA